MKTRSEVKRRKRKAIQLWLNGCTQQEISREIGVAQSVVSDYITKTSNRNKNHYRRLQLLRIDMLIDVAMESALGGSLPAIDKVLKLEERRAKLLGLDAPSDQHRVKSAGYSVIVKTKS